MRLGSSRRIREPCCCRYPAVARAIARLPVLAELQTAIGDVRTNLPDTEELNVKLDAQTATLEIVNTKLDAIDAILNPEIPPLPLPFAAPRVDFKPSPVTITHSRKY